MPDDNYASAVGGGLKLKGSKPSGVVKKKKKSKTSILPKNTQEQSVSGDASSIVDDPTEKTNERDNGDYDREEGKTDTEKKHEEMKRKRLNERLLKTGAKTHKERVEELNKYLSRLSEHHDMPKIGPG